MDGHTSFGWCLTHGIAISACPCPKPWTPAIETPPELVRQEAKGPGCCTICHSYTLPDDVVAAWPNGAVLCLWCLDNEGQNHKRPSQQVLDEIEMKPEDHALLCIKREVNG
ncbi:MAG: hypothetical protein AB7R89_16155 [Dehalococcoidia bacterium]